MKLAELFSSAKDLAIEFNTELNPALWEVNDGQAPALRPEVQQALLKIAASFLEALELKASDPVEIVFTGSNANYNWSKYSDIDLHFIIDEAPCSDGACSLDSDSCLQAKKSLWNLQHDMTVRGFPVEVYAHRSSEGSVLDSAAYSLTQRRWLRAPSEQLRGRAWPAEQVRLKADSLASEIDQAVEANANDPAALQDLADRVWRGRQAGLQAGGEASLENLTFKALRNGGYLDKLRSALARAQDAQLSI